MADQRIRVFTLRKKQESNLASFACLRQNLLQRAPGRGTSGVITVETEHHLAHQSKCAAQMLGGGCGSQRGHCVGEASLMQSHGVHVALDHQKAFECSSREARLIEAVE